MPPVAGTLSVSSDDFKAALARWASGVTVVTAAGPRGMTVSAFAALSLDPPLVTVALARDADAAHAIVAAEGFAVHVLGDHQDDLSVRFSTPGDRFAGIDVVSGRFDAPLLHGCPSRLICAHHGAVDGGDHTILIGRVVQVDVNDGEPLLYYRGAYRALAPRGT